MSAKEQFDPAILDTLTEEERAPIIGDGAQGDEAEALKALADAGEEDGDDGEDDGDDGEGGDASAEPDVAGDPEVAPPETAESASSPVEPARVVYDYQLPEDYQAKVDAIRAKEDELAQQFKDGELDFDAYRAATRELDLEREALTDMRVKAAIAQDMSQQTGEAEWIAALRAFNSTVAKADGIDYSKDLDKQADFDQFLKVLADKPDNADKSQEWFIEEAHKRVKALHGIVAPAPNNGKPNRRAPDMRHLPQTLADVPGSDGPGDVSDEFAALDSLDGLAFEDALATLKRTNPAAFARYEAR
jgi:hypothetical protein